MGNLKVLFMAGTDTTSLALSWAFYFLACDEELQQSIFEEASSRRRGSREPDELGVESSLWVVRVVKKTGLTPTSGL